MKEQQFATMTDSDLVDQFRRVAHEVGEAVVDWIPPAEKTRRLIRITNELRVRGRAARMQLAPLLSEKDRFVRYYAARHLLALIPDRARNIIEEAAKQHDAIAGDAGMTLRNIDAGIYNPK